LKDTWAAKRLGEVCDVLDRRRKPITRRDRAPGPYPYYGATGVVDHVDGYLFDEPLVLVGEDGAKWESGETTAFLIHGKCWVNNHAHVLRPHRNQVLDSWLVYYLNHSDLTPFISGLTVPKLNQGSLRAVPISLPSVATQQRIVGMLDEAFEGIATVRENAEKNLRNARALFESLLRSVFRDCPADSMTPIAEVAEVFDGPHATPKTVGSGPVFLGIRALQDGTVNLDETRHMTSADFATWTRRVRPQVDDVVFSYETRLGQAAIIPTGLECCLGRRMGLVRVNRDRVNPRFFVYQYISPPFRQFLEGKTIHGATVDRIAVREFPTFSVWVPDLDEQSHIVASLDALRVETSRLEGVYQRKLAALDELKRSLLHQAFSGQL
jgi:type I restriction enzyme S subunit